MADLIERVNALLKQERTAYSCQDYLCPYFQGRRLRAESNHPNLDIDDASSTGSSSLSSILIKEWREKITTWSYSVVDHYDFNREVVAISISLLDRFLTHRSLDKKQFQLAALTTLYLAIKLNEWNPLSIKGMTELGQGHFEVAHVRKMELDILTSLSWHVHPPTPFCIARHLSHLLPANSCSLAVKHDIMELTRFLTELSVADYFFVTRSPSSCGLAAFLNALDMTGTVSYHARLEFLANLKLLDDIGANSTEIDDCRTRLVALYEGGGYKHYSTKDGTDTSRTESPVSVANPNAFVYLQQLQNLGPAMDAAAQDEDFVSANALVRASGLE